VELVFLFLETEETNVFLKRRITQGASNKNIESFDCIKHIHKSTERNITWLRFKIQQSCNRTHYDKK